MKKSDWNEGLNHLDTDLIENYIIQRENLSKKRTKGFWVRFGAVAACFCLIVSAITLPIFKGLENNDISSNIGNSINDSVIAPPSSTSSSITDGPDIGDIVTPPEILSLTASEVSGVFDVQYDSVGTKQYTTVHVPSIEYLYLLSLPTDEYLPIYTSTYGIPSKDTLQRFIDKYKSGALTLAQLTDQNYEESDSTDDEWVIQTITGATCRINFTANKNSLIARILSRHSGNDKRMKVNDSFVSVMDSDTDEEMKEKLRDVIKYVSEAFGKEYTSIKIERLYPSGVYPYGQALKGVNVYLYNSAEEAFPESFSKAPSTPDYITLTFSGASYYYQNCAKDEVFLIEISLYEAIQNPSEYYTVKGVAKALSLEEAEALLENGYVFGGHSCDLCMKAQDAMDFSEYSYVSIEYVSDTKGALFVPFYVFYKYTRTLSEGYEAYAKTYVPAVEVSGLVEYFISQQGCHNNSYFPPAIAE